MKLASFRGQGGQPRTGAVADGRVFDIGDFITSLPIPTECAEALARRGVVAPAGGMLRLLYAGAGAMVMVAGELEALVRGGAASRPLGETVLLAPVPRPGKIVAVGRNYADHAKETGVDPFEQPRIIAKLPSCVTGPGSVVVRPRAVTKLDFDVELAVIIGAFAANVARERALGYVAGYSVLNDVSAREFQFDVSPPQTTFAKSMDGFCPMGPWLVTKDEIADPQGLEVACYVNGERMQHGHTHDMIFPVDRLIEYISGYMTLEPGDVIATGTPAGSGAFRTPPVWLASGDRVRLEVSRVGTLEHSIG